MSDISRNEEYIVLNSNHISPAVDIAGTAVVQTLQKQNPEKKIVVVSNYPETWLHNPFIYRIYKIGQTPYFFEDFIKGRKTKIIAHDPNKQNDFINKENHIIESWCQLCDIRYNNEQPKLYFTQRESEVSYRLTKTEKPIFLFQPYEMFGLLGIDNWSWTKDIPVVTANQIIHKMFLAGYETLVIKNQNQRLLNNSRNLNMNMRQALATIEFSQKRLFVDSFMQAAAAAVNKKSVVTWLATHPKQNGYNLHTNIITNINTEIKNRIDSYNPLFDIEGKILAENNDVTKFYNTDEIVKEILKD